MQRVIVRSRSGNVVLAVLGALYTLGALWALVTLSSEVWNAVGITDLALQAGLIGAAACGVWLLVNGLENLGVHVARHMPHFTHRTH
jgi:hypothetical protein